MKVLDDLFKSKVNVLLLVWLLGLLMVSYFTYFFVHPVVTGFFIGFAIGCFVTSIFYKKTSVFVQEKIKEFLG